ncbi:hypothetical protein [Chryseobacterium sp. ISL-6]|uniref:hypothetical protein n=1 Tax=Chryseobacterium sp. ISL-6 TaxID=2819143 RepID=UPI001BEA6A19|nr:hypothetical protein [Chryseobacterium sp. ISL-6]MBT2622250.1 hypothetical protein [Chryseobacterium sp. ISL-6]
MRNFFRMSALTLTVFLTFTSCSSDTDMQNDENMNVVAAKARTQNGEAKFEMPNIIQAYYSDSRMQHYYTIQDHPFPASYFKERVLGAVGPVVTSNPYITIWHNTNTGDSYISGIIDELQEANGWRKIKMLGAPINLNGTNIPVYEYFNTKRGSHFYTTSFNELGYGNDTWKYHGPRFYVTP